MKRRQPPIWLVVATVLVPVALLVWRVATKRGAAAVSSTPNSHAPSRTRDRARAYEAPACEAPTTAPLPTPTSRRRTPALQRPGLSVGFAMTSLALLVFISVPTTWATFNDQVTMTTVSATAGTVNDPTAFTVTDNGANIELGWTAPGSGLTPDNYEIFRATSSGGYAGSPTATDTASPFVDIAALECTNYWYKMRSARVNLPSGFTPEQGPINIDHTDPVISAGNLYFDPSPLPKVANFVKVSGGNVEVFANVTDNCSSGTGIAVNFTFGAPFSATVAATSVGGPWTPVAGGPTFNYRYAYTIPGATLTNGQNVTWSISATDAKGNNATAAGTTFTGDGVGPTAHVSKFVSAFTNYYSSAVGVGEITSTGTQAATGSYVYGGATDPTGISSMTANIDVNTTATYRIKTGSTAVPLVKGTYTLDTTGSTSSWDFRSAAQVINTGLGNGTRYYRVTAIDGLGNTATTSGDLPVEIDNTVPSNAAACTSGPAGASNNNILADPDYTDLDFADAIWPASIRSGWNGAAFTGTANLRNGTGNNDFFDFNTDFSMQLLQGTAQGTAFNLRVDVVTGTTPFANTQVSFTSATNLRIAYKTGSVSGISAGNATMFISANLRDPAGNKAAAAFSENCARGNW